MEILIVTLLVGIILFFSYVFFNRKAKRQKKEIDMKNTLIRDFYKQEINCMEELKLVGTGNDGNSDFEFKQAVKKINMSNNIRIQLYD
jgi:septation ring formation regulator EzrA